VNYKNFWYIACQTPELKNDRPLGRTILDEWIVLFRDENGKACALRDRCIHRNSQLSLGTVHQGKLQCPYHGWTFNGPGKLVHIPSEGPNQNKVGNRCAKSYSVIEQDGFVFVCLEQDDALGLTPFRMPHYGDKGWETVRLFNSFNNNVTNCAENYIDVPHTVFVHDKIFRVGKQEEVETKVTRENGNVHIEYGGETDNLGWFSWFLNPKKTPITHIDHFYMPNVTSVQYKFGRGEFWITSQCIPINDKLTHVWTDLTYDFGRLFNKIARPIVRYQGQSVIDQDIVALDNQMKVIEKYGTDFSNASADVVHVFIESIRDAIAKGEDPRTLPERKSVVKMWI
jgi:phenylpropionate dioxygenase-like ring-hydroxylating dioxygenase large terminal subunit